MSTRGYAVRLTPERLSTLLDETTGARWLLRWNAGEITLRPWSGPGDLEGCEEARVFCTRWEVRVQRGRPPLLLTESEAPLPGATPFGLQEDPPPVLLWGTGRQTPAGVRLVEVGAPGARSAAIAPAENRQYLLNCQVYTRTDGSAALTRYVGVSECPPPKEPC